MRKEALVSTRTTISAGIIIVILVMLGAGNYYLYQETLDLHKKNLDLHHKEMDIRRKELDRIEAVRARVEELEARCKD